ncbi:hypothetical protein BTR23_13170 [Alkalihalophilus pseudofirmus]|nr:hypothetical protein BTR23_13170 [Alkalihalophilus pseudofirmus]
MGAVVGNKEFVNVFSIKLLNEMTTPLKDTNLVEQIRNGDDKRIKKLCEEVNHEWGLLHDLLVESIAALLTFIGEYYGEEKVGEALKFMTEQVWEEPHNKINARERKEIVLALAATWRAHSTGGIGPEAGGFTIEEDDKKFTFKLEPCGSGQRLWKRGLYEHPKKFSKTKDEYLWSFNRKDFPYYCAHCTYMNEIMPIEWSGTPIYPLDPPKTKDHPCTWYYYKNPEDTPDRFYERYGYDKKKMLSKHNK